MLTKVRGAFSNNASACTIGHIRRDKGRSESKQMAAIEARIAGTGAHVPDSIITNHDLERMVDTNDEWIYSRTGIRERRRLKDGETVTDLAVQAATSALADARVLAQEVDLIIAATFTPELHFPGLGCMVQRGIGARRAAAFDINAVCAGFLYALVQASLLVQSGAFQTALVVAAEGLTRYVDYTDRNSCILFGDGASAAVVRAVPQAEGMTRHRGMLGFDLGTDGERVNVAFCPRSNAPESWLATLSERETVTPYIWQDGKAMFKAAVNGMTESLRRAFDRAGVNAADVNTLVPHQANMRILEAVAERVSVPADRVAVCLEEFGNTSAASMGIALDKWRRLDRIHDGDTVAFTAFAGGLTWGSAVFRM